MAQKTVVIKKYENRRLYDTTNSRYVNLEEVAQLLQQGNDVQVIDATSGEDITRLILTQIIVEDAKTPESTFPLDLLRQMVVASGRASQESALQYMKTMLEIYQNVYRAMPNPLNPFDFTQNARANTEERPDSETRASSDAKSKTAWLNSRSSYRSSPLPEQQKSESELKPLADVNIRSRILLLAVRSS